MLGICIGINAAFSVVCSIPNVSRIHDRCILGFIGFIAAGTYIALKMDNSDNCKPEPGGKQTFVLIFLAIMGVLYIYFMKYWELTPYIFRVNPGCSIPVVLWVGAVLAIVLCKLLNCQPVKVLQPFEVVGKASYHILCFQILFFDAYGFIIRHVKDDMKHLAVACGLVVCVIGGVLFWQIEDRIRKIRVKNAKKE